MSNTFLYILYNMKMHFKLYNYKYVFILYNMEIYSIFIILNTILDYAF